MPVVSSNGAVATARKLRELGVEIVFSVSGDQILPLYEALDRQGIRIVHARHEVAAVYMAEAWGQLRGVPGVCLVTAGPGHTSTITGLAAALASESPVLLLSGASPAGLLGRGAFQELDQAALAATVCVAAWVVASADEVTGTIQAAWDAALGGQDGWGVPGPVSVSLPIDVLDMPCSTPGFPPTAIAVPVDSDAEFEGSSQGPGRVQPAVGGTEARADTACGRVVDELCRAERPVLMVRPSLTRSCHDRAVSELANALPVLPTVSPRGGHDPAWGAKRAAFEAADLLVVFGPVDFSTGLDGPTTNSPRRVLQVSSRIPELAAARRWHEARQIELVAVLDAPEALVLWKLAAAIGPASHPLGSAAGQASLGADRRLVTVLMPPRAPEPSDATAPLHPLQVAAVIARHVAPEDVIVTDGGGFGQWMRAGFRHLSQRQLLNGKLGAIGGSIPQAIGASLAAGARTWAFLGDGTFGYCAAELDTAVRERLNLVVVVGNDSRWAAEWHHQAERYGPDRTIATAMEWRDLDRVAEGWGAIGASVQTAGALDSALAELQRAPLGGVRCWNIRIQSIPSRLAG
jgi:acetolactate synthase-1/2/3 large subunit